MIPTQLSEWSLDAVLYLLSIGAYETEFFDFKEKLPHRRNGDDKERLRKTFCAFANSEGGFLVFGISDDRSLPPMARVLGLDPADDFPEHIGNYPRECSPSIYWDFLNPPLPLESGRVIPVVHIPKSWQAPHAVGSANEGWSFQKRTNKGNEGMSLEEVRLTFLGYYEKRLKLQLLRAELATLKKNANEAYLIEEKEVETRYTFVTFETRVIETVLSDTYTIIAEEKELLEALTGIRQRARNANNKIHMFLATMPMPLTNKQAIIRQHNEWLRPVCEGMVQLADTAIVALDNVLR